jgi:hypothetical protein
MLSVLFLGLSLLTSAANGAPTVTIGRTNVIGTEFDPARVEFFGGRVWLPDVELISLHLARHPVCPTSCSTNASHISRTHHHYQCANIRRFEIWRCVLAKCATRNHFAPCPVFFIFMFKCLGFASKSGIRRLLEFKCIPPSRDYTDS